MINPIQIFPRKEPADLGIHALRGMPSTVISDMLGRTLVAKGILPIHRSPMSVCGNAFTIKVRTADNLMVHKALQMVRAGDVMVIDAEGDIGCAVIGEILTRVAKSRGVAGIVVDGAVRDDTVVNPGDIILGDRDGVIAIPPSLAAEAARLGQEKIKQEQEILKTIEAGTYATPWVDELLIKKGVKL